jgi:hypothetical protein
MPEGRRHDRAVREAADLRECVAPQSTVWHLSEILQCRMPQLRTVSVDSSLNAQLLPTVLSDIAGSVEAISFPGLGGLFIAHATGNLVIHAAHLVRGGGAPVAPMLSVPVFAIPATSTRASGSIASKTRFASVAAIPS